MSARIFKLCLLAVFCMYSAAPVQALEPGEGMPVIVGKTTEGSLFDLECIKGKVVLVDFWASWCEPCKKSLPWMELIQSKYRAQGLQIIAVNLDEERRAADTLLHELKIKEIMTLFDSHGESAESFAVKAMPSTYLFDKAGKLVHMEAGYRESKAKALELEIQKLVGATK
jgi:cytochrome c biogenesis protein CcmG/thiol:disulfide interchange protein DsbE